MRTRSLRAATAGFLMIVTVAPAAHATPTFPATLAAHLGLSSAPDCSLCHTATPQRGNVTTPFGTSMRERGLRAYDEASLRTALDALAAEKKDSDGDGAPDIDELKAGTNPNGGAGETIVPGYGCGLVGRDSSRSAWWLVIASVGLVALRAARVRARLRRR